MPGLYVPTGIPVVFTCPGQPTVVAPLINTYPFAVLFNGVPPALFVGLTAAGFPCVAALVTIAVFVDANPLVIAGSPLTVILPAGVYTGVAPAGVGIIIT